MNKLKIAVIGATGMVGRVMIQVLEESEVLRDIELIPAATERSAGKKISFQDKEIEAAF